LPLRRSAAAIRLPSDSAYRARRSSFTVD
jgi:hypothetical protein